MYKYEKTVLDDLDSKEDIYFEKLLKCFNHNRMLLVECGVLQSEIDECKHELIVKEREILATKAKYNIKVDVLSKKITKESNKEIMRLQCLNKHLRRQSKLHSSENFILIKKNRSLTNLNTSLENQNKALIKKIGSLHKHLELRDKSKSKISKVLKEREEVVKFYKKLCISLIGAENMQEHYDEIKKIEESIRND